MDWKQSEIPMSVEEAKKTAKDFLKTNDLTEDGIIKFMSAKLISESRTLLTYENGRDGAIQVAVDVLAGKVENFEYISRQQAIEISKPVKEGEGIG